MIMLLSLKYKKVRRCKVYLIFFHQEYSMEKESMEVDEEWLNYK